MQVCMVVGVNVCAFVCVSVGAVPGGKGQSKMGVQVPDKMLDLTNLTSKDVDRWISPSVTL